MGKRIRKRLIVLTPQPPLHCMAEGECSLLCLTGRFAVDIVPGSALTPFGDMALNPSASRHGEGLSEMSCAPFSLRGLLESAGVSACYACLCARPPLNLPRARGRRDRHHRTDSPLPVHGERDGDGGLITG